MALRRGSYPGRPRPARAAVPHARAPARPAAPRTPWPAAAAPRRAHRPRVWPARRPAPAGPDGPAGPSGRRRACRRRLRGQAATGLGGRPALEFSGDVLVGPAVACARCQARRSGSAPEAVAAARARWTSWRSCAEAGGRPRTGPADDGTGPARRARSARVGGRGGGLDRDAGPAAACHTSSGSPTGSAAAISSSRRVPAGRSPSRDRKPSSARPGQAGASGSPNPPASSSGVSPLASSSTAPGLPRVSATIRSRTCSSSGPATTDVSSARASRSASPCTASSGSPARSCWWPGWRREDDRDRRARQMAGHEPEGLPEARSSQCALSATHTSGRPRPPPTAGSAPPGRPRDDPGCRPLAC